MERNVFTKLNKIFNVCLIILRTPGITGVILYGFLDLIEVCVFAPQLLVLLIQYRIMDILKRTRLKV